MAMNIPAPYTVNLPALPDHLEELEAWINDREACKQPLRPDNHARIIWHGERKRPTPYAMVYLHGFTASQGEGDPLHRKLAERFGCNLFLPRLAGHGRHGSDFADLSPQTYLNSAAEAVAIAERLGRRVIVLGTSAGAMLAMVLSAWYTGGDTGLARPFAMLTYSPLIDFHDRRAAWLTNPVFKSSMRLLTRLSKRFQFRSNKPAHSVADRYWYPDYHIQGLIALSDLVHHTMHPETFRRITHPFFLGYYYKSRKVQDPVASVPAMLHMYEQLGTPSQLKRKVAFPEAGGHVISSKYLNSGYNRVIRQSGDFLSEMMERAVRFDTEPEKAR